MDTQDLIYSYYERFNERDVQGMLALLDPDVVHEVSQGKTEVGADAFSKFLEHMNDCYQENVHELVVMCTPAGDRAAAEFQLQGRYLLRDGNFPEATGQDYHLRVGAFFEVNEQRITRVSNHYNLRDWLDQISGR